MHASLLLCFLGRHHFFIWYHIVYAAYALFWAELCLLKSICWSFNLQDLRIRLYLKIGPLKRKLNDNEVIHPKWLVSLQKEEIRIQQNRKRDNHVRTQREGSQPRAKEGDSEETKPAYIFILGFRNCGKIIPPSMWYFVMATLTNKYMHQN